MHALWVVVSIAVTAASPAAGPKCGNEVKATRAWMDTLGSLASNAKLNIEPEIHLINLEGPAVKLPGGFAVVSVSPIAFWVNGKRLDARTTDAVQAALREAKEKLETQGAPLDSAGPGAVLAIDKDSKWSSVVAVGEAALAAGFNRLIFVFESPNVRVAPAEPSNVDEDLQALGRVNDPALKSQKLSAVYRRILGPCPELSAAAADAQSGTPAEFIQAISDALPRCECKVDLPSLKAALWNTFSVESRTGLLISIAPTGKNVVASPSDSWDRIHGLLVSTVAKTKGPLRLSDGTEQRTTTPLKRTGKLTK